MSRTNIDMRQGAIELLVLKTLTWGPQHGYTIARWIQQTADDVLRIEEGSLYPALRRLEEKQFVRSAWGSSENNRRAKFYKLTETGRTELKSESVSWLRYAEAVAKVLHATRQPA
ncbi:MAG: PadR family transcriptional regulator [Gemmatimonadota bacterium]|nr:PadR family transcriptional regulator [Gemmatimonadota bacterium]